ncbi:unnamed protein product, partial [Symbiodinium microadriaticum]
DVHVALAFPTQSGAQSGAFRVLHSVLSTRLCQRTKGTELGCVSTAMEGGLEAVFMSASSTASAEVLLALVVDELKNIAADAGKASAVAKKVSLHNLVGLEGGACATDVMLAASAAGVSLKDFADVRAVSASDVKKAAEFMLNATPAYAVVGASYGMQSYSSVCNLLK